MCPQWFELTFSAKCFKVSRIKIDILESISNYAPYFAQWILETTPCDTKWPNFAKHIKKTQKQ